MSGVKRKRDGFSPKLKSKKSRKKQKSKNGHAIVPKTNQFDALPVNDSNSESDSSIIFDHEARSELIEPEIVLVDSDDEENVPSEPPIKHLQNDNGGIAGNDDFIGFGFSSSDDEQDQEDGEFSDDGILSGDEGNLHQSETLSTAYPWVKDHDHSKQKEIADWLTNEMKDFVNYISPSCEEIETRNRVIGKLKRSISSFWPQTETHVFGSCATDLYLPGSDIDMVVVSQTGDYENRSRLYQLSSFLRNKKLAKNIEVIAKAKVPIIKFVDPQTNINIDISFERTNGILAAKKIRKWLSVAPGLRELVLTVKQFLRSRKLNNVHVGGLGGYATIILCYHFLALHPKISTGCMDSLDNLGTLLIEFFELYGRNFSYDNLIIALDPETDAPMYFQKQDYPNLNTSRNTFSIVIQDPSDPDNNITRSSYNLRDLKKAFGGAYQLLVEKCYELNGASYKERLGQLILGDIIKYRGKERDFNDDRHKVVNHALIKHDDEDDEESTPEVMIGKDVEFYTDLTVDSDDEDDYVPELKNDNKNSNKNQNSEIVKKKISNMLSIEESEDEYVPTLKEEEETTKTKYKSNLDKDTKRDYWLNKGLELSQK